jgi:NTE family protein
MSARAAGERSPGPAEASGLRTLAPEMIGTRVGELIEPCRSYTAPTPPSDPPSGPPVAVALSGGGFRATLAGLGVLRFLADAGLLGNVRYVSSVSGGSIANGVFATAYPKLAADGFSAYAFDRLVLAPVVDRVTGGSLSSVLVRGMWRILGPTSRTSLLADALDAWFFEGALLHELDPRCRFIVNAANLTTGARFGFEREVLGDYVTGTIPSGGVGLRVADAVAASAAVPGIFSAYTPPGRFPCADGSAPKLVDGGAYDNMGLEPLDDLPRAVLVALNAGGIFRPGPFGGLPIVRDLQRSEGLLYRQSTSLRMRAMVERFREWERADERGETPPASARRGVLFALATTVEPTDEWADGRTPLPDRERLRIARLPTSFSRFAIDDVRGLVYQGWWLTGACLSRFHGDLIERPFPAWRQIRDG